MENALTEGDALARVACALYLAPERPRNVEQITKEHCPGMPYGTLAGYLSKFRQSGICARVDDPTGARAVLWTLTPEWVGIARNTAEERFVSRVRTTMHERFRERDRKRKRKSSKKSEKSNGKPVVYLGLTLTIDEQEVKLDWNTALALYEQLAEALEKTTSS